MENGTAWSILIVGGRCVAVARCEARWSVVGRRGGRSAASLDAALRSAQIS